MLLVTHNHALGRCFADLDVTFHPTVGDVHFLETTSGMLTLGLLLQESWVEGGWDWQSGIMWLNNVEWIASELATTIQVIVIVTVPLAVSDWPPWTVWAFLSHDTTAMSVLTMSNLPFTIDTDGLFLRGGVAVWAVEVANLLNIEIPLGLVSVWL